MKNKLMLALSLATVAAVSAAPLSAQATQGKNRNNGVYNQSGVNSGCSWYDVNCRVNGGNNTSAGSWQVIGRDNSGNTIYQRQRVDGNGNVIVDRARQDSYGRMVIIDSQVVQNNNNNARRNNTVYGQNNADCKYKSNKNGYSTNCKYNKANKGNKNRGNGNYNNNTSGPWYDQNVRSNGKGNGKHH